MGFGKTQQHEEKGKLADDILVVHVLLVRVIHVPPSQALVRINAGQMDFWRIFVDTESDDIAFCRDISLCQRVYEIQWGYVPA